MKYYYFIASLPTLTPGAPTPHDLDGFLDLCRRHLIPADLREVEALLQGDAAAARSDFAHAWSTSRAIAPSVLGPWDTEHV